MAQQDEITKIISLELNYKDLLDGLSKVQAEFVKQNELLQESNEAYKKGDISLKDYSQELAEISTKKKNLTGVMQQYQREIQNNIKVETQAEGSLNALRAQASKLTARFNSMGREMREGLEGQKLVAEIQKIQDEVSKAEISIRNFRSRVGSYSDAAQGFTKLNFSIQQVVREFPSLTNSLSQYFLAISNNLPMLGDELARVREENKKLQAQGLPTVNVLKQVVQSLFSWQTALVLIITLLTAFSDDIIEFAKNLFKGKDAIDAMAKAHEQLHRAQVQGAVDAQEEITKLRLMKGVAEDVTRSMEERLAAVRNLRAEYPDYLAKLTDEEILNGQLSRSIETLVQRIIKLNQARQALNQLVENEENLQLLKEQGKAYEELTKAAEAFDNVGRSKTVYLGRNTAIRKEYSDYLKANKSFLKQLEASGDEGAKLVETIKEDFDGKVDQYIKSLNAAKAKLEASAQELFTEENGKKPSGGGGRTSTTEADSQSAQLAKIRQQTQRIADETFRIYSELHEKTRDEELRMFDETQRRKIAVIEQRQQEINNYITAGEMEVNGKKIALNVELLTALLLQEQAYEQQKTQLTESGAMERAAIEKKWADKAQADKAAADRAAEAAKRGEIQGFLQEQRGKNREYSLLQQGNKIEEEAAGLGGNEMARLQAERLNLFEEEAKALLMQKELEEGTYSDLIKSSDEYANAKVEAANRVAAAQLELEKNEKNMKKAALASASEALSGFSALTGGFSQLAEAMGADAGVVRGMAIAQSALGLAAGIAQAAMMPFPANLAAIGSVVATLATIITQIKELNSESESEQYAQGGLIPVSGNAGIIKGRSHANGGVAVSLDGQKVAEVEGGELLAVVNKRDTAQLKALSALNSRHGRRFADGGLIDFSGVYNRIGLPTANVIQTTDTSGAFQYELMRSAMLEAVSQVRPQVAVRDISRVQGQVAVRDSYAKSGRIKRKTAK